jgi:hypothetical protein
MRHFVLGFLFIVAFPATSAAPEASMRYACYQDKLYVQISVHKAGVYTVVLPSAACGPSV